MRKSFLILPSILLLSQFSARAGGEGDNSVLQQIQFRDYNYIGNIESSAINPVSISYMPLSELAVIGVGYGWNQGDYHRIDQSSHSDVLSVSAFGQKRLERVAFEGGVTYYNENNRARCWNSTLFQSSLNPFILADSEPSDYNTERFHVRGKLSYDFSKRFRFGLNADYNVGVMSDEKDPRLETKGMRFVFNPGVQYDLTSKFAVGATAGLNLFNESSKYSCVQTAVNYPFFVMSGLGTFYPQTGSSYTRDAKGTSWFAGLDFKYSFNDNIADYLSLSYSHENENATDGGSTYQFKAGEYTNGVMRLYNRLSIKSNSFVHNVEIRAESNDVKGRWFDQKSVTVNGTTHYEVMGSSIKHKELRSNAEASYRLDILDRENVPQLSAGIFAGFLSSDTKNFPELYRQKYNRLTIGANVAKYFSVKKVRLGIALDGNYGMCLSSQHDFEGLELKDSYCLPMYAYLTSTAYSVNGRIDAKLPVRDLIVGAYVGGGTQQCVGGKLDYYKNDGMNSLCFGLSLAF